MKKYIALLFITISLNTFGQVWSDTITYFFFNNSNDTIISLNIFDYHLKQKDKFVLHKIYRTNNSTKSITIDPNSKSYMLDSLSPIDIAMDSLAKIGYELGDNVSTNLEVYTDISIKKETIDKTFGNLYKYDLHRKIVLESDTIYVDSYFGEEQRINNNLDANIEIARNIDYRPTVWRSKDKRLFYCIFDSGRSEYSISDGNEYYIKTRETALLKK